MRQDEIISIMRELGPCTSGDISRRHAPDARRSQAGKVTQQLKKMALYDIVRITGTTYVSGSGHTTAVWELVE